MAHIKGYNCCFHLLTCGGICGLIAPMNDESTALFHRAHESLLKYDYYLCTVAGALCAYIAQTYTPQRLDSVFSILQTTSLMFLAASFWVGVKRIQITNMFIRLDYEYLEMRSAIEDYDESLEKGFPSYTNTTTGESITREELKLKRNALVGQLAQRNAQTPAEKLKARHLGMAQMYLLLTGFSIIVIAKVWQPYQSDFSHHPTATALTTNTPAQSLLETQANKPSK